jgi:hypothetical protein
LPNIFFASPFVFFAASFIFVAPPFVPVALPFIFFAPPFIFGAAPFPPAEIYRTKSFPARETGWRLFLIFVKNTQKGRNDEDYCGGNELRRPQ